VVLSVRDGRVIREDGVNRSNKHIQGIVRTSLAAEQRRHVLNLNSRKRGQNKTERNVKVSIFSQTISPRKSIAVLTVVVRIKTGT